MNTWIFLFIFQTNLNKTIQILHKSKPQLSKRQKGEKKKEKKGPKDPQHLGPFDNFFENSYNLKVFLKIIF